MQRSRVLRQIAPVPPTLVAADGPTIPRARWRDESLRLRGTGAGSRTTRGQKTGSSVGADRSTYLPCFTNRGHGDICIGCTSHPPATAFTVHPARAHRRFVFTCPWHYRIAGAIVAGDADVATLLMRRHIANSWAAFEAQLRDEVTS